MKKSKQPVFKYDLFGDIHKVVFYVARYTINNNLFVGLKIARTGEIFADVTTNFECSHEDYYANIKNCDENEGMAKFLLENDLGFFVGNPSDPYPMFFFDPLMLHYVDPDGFKEISKK